MPTNDTLRVLLPASMGRANADEGCAALEQFLNQRLGPQFKFKVESASSYAALWRELSSGKAQMGWGPPFVCARMELQNGRALVQAIRNGAASYRAALVCRKGEAPASSDYSALNAAWSDRDSTSGYLLPRAWLFGRGQDPDHAFKNVRFRGSFRACIDSLLDGGSDITAVYATAAGSLEHHTALDNLPAEEREGLEVFSYTDESPTDAIVVGSEFDPDLAQKITNLFLGARQDSDAAGVFEKVFDTREFVAAAPRAYQALHQIILQGVKLA
jgi:phosphonate transport system substrate-binding protein